MVFSSLVFLCLFLPVNLLLYYSVKNKTWRNWLLIVSSLFFYAWGEPVWITLMLFSTFFDWFNARMMEKHRDKAKFFLLLSLVGNLGLLGLFKYSGFLVENLNALLHIQMAVPRFALPIGISFYTFQTLSYVIDVYRGEVEAQKSPAKLLLFVSLFHQLIAGPIVRYVDIAAEIENRHVTIEKFTEGVNRFIIGLGKKVLIANTAGEVATSFLGTDYDKLPVAGAWLGILLFAFQIFFDFSGYSDMAIGLGKMYGFTYKENFDYPYISKSATEFWRRWHISLGTFFRDYLYIPLGGNRRFQVRNLLIVWFLTGLWHGASWNFILWGVYYGALIILEKFFLMKVLEKIPALFSHLYLILATLVGWVFFYHINLGDAFRFLWTMFGHAPSFSSGEISILFGSNILFILIAAVACTPLVKKLFLACKAALGRNQVQLAFMERIFKPLVNIFILVLSLVFLVGQSYNPFLYFRF